MTEPEVDPTNGTVEPESTEQSERVTPEDETEVTEHDAESEQDDA